MPEHFKRLGITDANPVLLHVADVPQMGGRYQICKRCRFILQDFRTGEDRASGLTVADGPPVWGLPVWDGLVGYNHATGSGWHVPETEAGDLTACRPKCGLAIDGVSCVEPSVYDVVFDDCVTCQRHGALMCLTHPVCVEHGAVARGPGFEWAFGVGDEDDGRDVVVEQIAATYKAAS